MVRKMTKREIKWYEKRFSEDILRQDPKRDRKFVRVLGASSGNWATHTCLFTEELEVVGKEIWTDDKTCYLNYDFIGEAGFKKEDFVDENGYTRVILFNYGSISYGYVRHEKDGLAPARCTIEDFDKYNIGDKVKVYVFWMSSYDGTDIGLNLYDFWVNHKPRLVTSFLFW